jgi:cytochrome c oxidase subunit 2
MELNQFINLLSLFILILIIVSYFSLFCDVAVNYQTSIQDPATDCLEWMTSFHDLLMADMILIIAIIFFLILTLIIDPIHHRNSNSYFSHSQNLEIFWTVVPALILLSIAYPSFNLLYSLDDLTDPVLTVKIIGHQWYWSYEFLDLDFQACEFDSYMVPTEDLILGEFRLLTTDNQLALPKAVPIKLLITSADVLHCWAVPSFGIKIDSCPGRLNEASLYVKRTGLYFGQCSEICGVNHGFMPIMVTVNSVDEWVSQSLPEAVFSSKFVLEKK